MSVLGSRSRPPHRRLPPAVSPDGLWRRMSSLEGRWKLTKGRELTYTLRETDERFASRTVSLRGAITRADAHTLVFGFRQVDRTRLRTAQELSLSGRWQADARNRLTFLVERADGVEDRLTLSGGWEIGPHHELRYRAQRGAGDRAERLLRFDGAWDVTGADRIVYRLAGSTRSAFEFRAALQSPSLFAREGRLVYQVGMGLERGTSRRQRVTLFGAWKLNRDRSVSFEVPYADGRVQAIRFEGTFSSARRDRVAVALITRRHEPLGLTVTFTRDVLPDAKLFLRLRQDAEEQAVMGGVQVRF
ncbi:MAG: hypothetical protein HY599_06810 [Candidatus Omnitrophica bacterium]|nr:hypothetical protein [Candidatus Omnitrophota bacterium]